MRNLASSLIIHERITTTLARAKRVRPVVEKMITKGRKKSLHSVRVLLKDLQSKDTVRKLTDDIGPGYTDRKGGYTRIVKIGPRKGDGAEMAIIELVGRNGDEQRVRKKKKKSKKKQQKPSLPKGGENASGKGLESSVQESKNAESIDENEKPAVSDTKDGKDTPDSDSVSEEKAENQPDSEKTVDKEEGESAVKNEDVSNENDKDDTEDKKT